MRAYAPLLLVAVGGLSLATAMPASAAVTFINASINVDTYAQATSATGTTYGTGSGSDFGVVAAELDASAASSARRPAINPVSRASSTLDAVATFAPDGSSGTLDALYDLRTATSNASAFAYAGGSYSYSYTFSVDVASVLTGSYSIPHQGPSIYTFLNGPSNYSGALSAGSGAGTLALDPGQYTLQIYSYGYYNTGTSGIGNVSNLTGTDSYAFAITSAVPEAGTWALLIVGFGAVGGAMRRRRVIRTQVAFA